MTATSEGSGRLRRAKARSIPSSATSAGVRTSASSTTACAIRRKPSSTTSPWPTLNRNSETWEVESQLEVRNQNEAGNWRLKPESRADYVRSLPKASVTDEINNPIDQYCRVDQGFHSCAR